MAAAGNGSLPECRARHEILTEQRMITSRTSVLTIAVATLAAAALLLRCVAVAEPLGIDQSLWASAVRGMSRGQRLYRDVWEQRPPGIYWIYLAGFRVFGWTPAAVAWLDILASAATTVLIYAIVRPLASSTTAALASALYAVLTMPASLYSHGGILERSVCETFIVVCVALSAWCAVGYRDRGSLAFAFGVGLFAGGAIVLKPNAAVYLPALLLWMAFYRRDTALGTPASVVRPVAVATIAVMIVPVVALAWLWSLGLLREARIAVVDFNRFYVSQGFSVAIYALALSKALWLRIKTDPLWLAGAAGAVLVVSDLARTRRLPPLAGLAVCWGGAAALAIVVNGKYLFNSYFIQALAPLAILGAWLLGESVRPSNARRAIGWVTAALMLVLLMQRQYAARVWESARADVDRLRGRTDAATYLEGFGGYGSGRGYSARANAELATYVKAHTAPDERVFLFGINGAGVYFAADRLAAQRFLRANFFVSTDFPDPRFRLEPVTDELAAARPRYVIFERLNSQSEMGRAVDHLPEQPAVARLLGGYRKEAQIEDFTLYRRVE
jgi:4-amino-4-deoxy-L-arabinose transferase-like glycosyltransferase